MDNPVERGTMTEPRVRVPDGYHLIDYDVLGSTNDEAKRLALVGCPDFSVVWAREQTGGRGRRGRQWYPVKGNLYLSILLRPVIPACDIARFSFVAAVAVARTVQHYCGETSCVRLKWPNDVLVDGKKIAGILLETQSGADWDIPWLVIGIGLNLTGAPPGLDYPATALAAHAASPVPCGAVVACLLQNFDDVYRLHQEKGFAAIRDAWGALAFGIGTMITVHHRDERLCGVFLGLDEDGALRLACGRRGQVRVTAGDVFFSDPEGTYAPGH